MKRTSLCAGGVSWPNTPSRKALSEACEPTGSPGAANNGVLKLFRTLTRPFYAVAHKLTRGRGGASSQSIVALLITVLGIVLTQLGFILWVIFAA